MNWPTGSTRCCGCARSSAKNRHRGSKITCARRWGASILVLTARQIGKTTVAAWAIAHYMLFTPGGLSVVACPTQPQSAEAVRKVREILVRVGAELTVNNVYGLELKNGSRVKALPGSDDSIRGLTVDGWIVADEAARARQRPDQRPAPDAGPPPTRALCDAVDGLEPHRSVLDGMVGRRRSIVAAAESHRDEVPGLHPAEYLDQERRALGEHIFNREYCGIPGGAEASPFGWDLYERATRIHVPLVAPGTAFAPPAEHSVPGANPFRRLQINGAFR